MSGNRCCPSSFNGKISEIPGIAVDNFAGDNATSRAFFLSHYHQDHVEGLQFATLLDHLRKTNAYIYTTEITFSIIKHKVMNLELLEYVKPLGKDRKMIALPSVPENKLDELFVEVTLIPAGHCLGSTMFLFKTPSKTVLYTGDFRIRINDIAKYGKLHERNGDPIHIDAMYADTTFIDGKFEEFPKRSETAQTLIDEIDKWLKLGKEHAVAIYMPANFTHEFLFNKIHERLKLKVYVSDDKWCLYSTMPEVVPGITNDDSVTRIHLCRSKWERYPHPACVSQNYAKYLFVYLTATRWQNYEIDESPIEHFSPTRLNVCFATHCSRRELVSFVSYFKPTKVFGFPNSYVAGTPVKKGNNMFVLTPKDRSASGRKRGYDMTVVKDNVRKNASRKILQ